MEDLFQTALGISSPWYIESLKFDVETSRLDIFIDFKRGTTFTDNEEKEPSGKEYKAYDTVKKEWRHMNFFQHECYLHARVPRVKRDDGKVRLISPPWSGKVNGFTLLFEAFLLQMCRSMPVHHVCKLTHISDHRRWSLLENYVGSYRRRSQHTIGMDETSAARGHDYIVSA